MSEIKVNKISPRTACGTTTLGDSGDSFVIPSGVTITNNGTQTGFGRTGTVDWQTSSIKTATFTATSGEGYFCNTAGGGFEVDDSNGFQLIMRSKSFTIEDGDGLKPGHIRFVYQFLILRYRFFNQDIQCVL